MAQNLRNAFPEYQRQKIPVFRRSVGKAYEFILEDKGYDEEDGNRRTSRRKSPSPASLEPEDIMTRPKNNMNNVLSRLYEQQKSTSAPASPIQNVIVLDDDMDHETAPVVNDCDQNQVHLPSDIAVIDVEGDQGLQEISILNESHNGGRHEVDIPISKSQEDSHVITTKENVVKDTSEKSKKKDNEARSVKKQKHVVMPKEFSTEVPKTVFADMGGCKESISEAIKIVRHLRFPKAFQRLGAPPPCGCLIHGPPGCGKTMLAKAMAGTFGIPMMSVSATELISGVSGDSEGLIRSVFEQARNSAPCIIFIDGIDVIAKSRERAQRDMEVRVISQLISSLNDIKDEHSMMVIGATDRLDVIDPAIRTGGRLERDIAMGIPDKNARHAILQVLCKNYRLGEQVDLEELSKLTPGFVGADLRSLITTAASLAEDRFFVHMEDKHNEENSSLDDLYSWMDRSELVEESLDRLAVEMDDFHLALKRIRPSSIKEGFLTVPNITFEDIGALGDVRRELENAICMPVKFPELMDSLGLDTPSGVLLYGPPGCGKTLLAKAVANQAQINFISVKGPEIVNMYVGESERAVRQIFQRARNSAPCVIFFDEIDSICPKRSGHDSGSGSNRIVNQLLTEMDGIEGRKGVFVMGATNRADMIDEAILRPGRLTNILYVGLPDSNGREDILRRITKHGRKPKLAEDVDLKEIAMAESCDGFSGADLDNLVRKAAQFRMEEMYQELDKEHESIVSKRHFDKAFSFVKPSISREKRTLYETMAKRFRQ